MKVRLCTMTIRKYCYPTVLLLLFSLGISQAEIVDLIPMLLTEWGLGYPTNKYVPDELIVDGIKPGVGCQAVAMAQVLYYYKYPAILTTPVEFNELNTGNDDITYSYQYLNPNSGSFSDIEIYASSAGMTPYDWQEMPLYIRDYSNRVVATETEVEAVSQLIFHCAAAIRSHFKINTTVATRNPVEAYRKVFGYACDNLQWKEDYPIDLWFYRIQNNIENNHPVVLANLVTKANPTAIGHRYVVIACDRDGAQNYGFKYSVSFLNGNWGLDDGWISILSNSLATLAIFEIQPNPDSLIPDPPEAEELKVGYSDGLLKLAWQPFSRAERYLLIRKNQERADAQWQIAPICKGENELEYNWLINTCTHDSCNGVYAYRVIGIGKGGWTFSEPVIACPENVFANLQGY